MNLPGKLWGLPNTLVGCAALLPALARGARLRFANNALEVIGHPWMLAHGAIALGNVILYGRAVRPDTPLGAGVTLGDHERQHTFQSERLGPLYLPLHLWYGLRAIRRDGRWHGPANRLEAGPLASPPRPWA